MAHLVELYKRLGKVRKVQAIDLTQLPATIFQAYIDNTVAHYEKMDAQRLRRLYGHYDHVSDPVQDNTTVYGPSKRILVTIEEGKPLSAFEGGDTPSDDMHQQTTSGQKGVQGSSLMGTATVEMARPPGFSGSLGLGIAGGADKEYNALVSCLRAGSIAHRCDGLQVGDQLVSINGIRVADLTHEQILTLLRNTGDTIVFVVHYHLDDPCFRKPANTFCKATDVVIEKEHGNFGFTMRGGSYGPDASKHRPLTVTAVRSGGPADREGRLRVGDRILSVNGVDVYSATLQAAQHLLRASGQHVAITIEYDVSILESVRNATGPLLLEIDKPPGTDLRMELALEEYGQSRGVYIDRLEPAGIADRCGALTEGDRLMAIDGVCLEYTTLPEAHQLLRNSVSSTIRIEIQPRRSLQLQQHAASPPPAIRCRSKSDKFPTRKQQSLRERRNFSRDRVDSRSPEYQSVVQPRPRPSQETVSANGPISYRTPQDTQSVRSRYSQKNYTNLTINPSQGSVSGTVSGVPSGQVCHSEVMEVVLNSWARGGFGLILHRQQTFSDYSKPPLFISYIEKGSPAEKSGVLQVGDRVLAINDWCTANGTPEEANYIIRHASSPLTLTVEFDVVETVLPSSGIFTVKLAKRGQNLGIVITSSSSGHKGEPVIVNDVRTGSVAHRCGSILSGDQLLGIDNIPLDTCTVEEAVRLLQRSADIVKLRVRKCGAFTQEEEASMSQTVVYSVELSRQRGPLGITIASTDEPGDPIFISQLAPGGLAERTGALHVSDRILAINGQSLHGKRVSEAMQILQAAGEVVCLKIARYVDAPFHYPRAPMSSGYAGHNDFFDHNYHDHNLHAGCEKLGTPVQSIDSAVESLEDSPIADNQPSSSNANHRLSHNSKSSGISANSDKFVEELSQHLRQSMSTIRSGAASSTQQSKSYVEVTSCTSSSGMAGPGSDKADSAIGSQSDNGNDPFCGCNCQTNAGASSNIQGPSANEDWMRVLEALETVGEAEMLRKLEESIMAGSVPQQSTALHGRGAGGALSSSVSNLNPSSSTATNYKPFPLTNTILRHPNSIQSHHVTFCPTRTDSNPSLNSASTDNNSSTSGSRDVTGKSGKQEPLLKISTAQMNGATNDFEHIPYITSPVNDYQHEQVACSSKETSSTSTPSSIQLSCGSTTPQADSERSRSGPPLEVHRVTLFKDNDYNDFGFSVSDGIDKKGVYINKVRQGGPADLSGNIRPLDRVLQVNEQSLQDLDCLLAVPLLLSASDSVELLICRDPNACVTLRPPSIEEEDEQTVQASV